MTKDAETRDWLAEAKAWIGEDPDPITRQELQALLDTNDLNEVRERFASRLAFGTAGIRGTIGAGPGRMNRALVRRVTAGLANYLLAVAPDCRKQGVVVARDARHMSREFADDTASVLVGAGIPVHEFADPVPTPVCAFAVTALGASAGVMITASHNPPADNGYKVYWENGAQIVPPHDQGISHAVDAVNALGSIAMMDTEQARKHSLLTFVPDHITEKYFDAILALRKHPEAVPKTDPRIVYTPLHGVGGWWVKEAFARARISGLRIVPEQAEPDPDFPTVRFPNPEEPGAMDLALAQARRANADLVLANDPDADRLAVAMRDEDGGYVQLSGNELGLLLAHYLLTENPPAGKKVVMTTVVSTSLLRRMAEGFGTEYAETLTGFKWIANKAIELKPKGITFVIGFEEALGYTAGEVVRDKDGVSTALLTADMALYLKSQGKDLLDQLEHIYRRFGLAVSAQKSAVLPGSEGIAKMREITARLRDRPPAEMAGKSVLVRTDLQNGTRWERDGGGLKKMDLPPSDVLIFELE
ncbi:MAG TPA: phospho-sugar mutase, partial [Candidatus Eisenbacteria bacterium]|nr:phospho-sugar mutase [Candidatus Eisenbacteria bacterium]